MFLSLFQNDGFQLNKTLDVPDAVKVSGQVTFVNVGKLHFTHAHVTVLVWLHCCSMVCVCYVYMGYNFILTRQRNAWLLQNTKPLPGEECTPPAQISY